MEAVRAGNPQLDPHRVHEVLAAMGLRAGRTDQICQTLSGEALRVALASGLLRTRLRSCSSSTNRATISTCHRSRRW